MDGIDYCEECEREHREEVKELMEQLKAKEQECEELKRKVKLMMDCPDCKVDEYKKALEEIEEYINEEELNILPHVIIGIKNIIRRAKGEE